MATLIDLQSQIEELKKQAEQIRSKDFDATLADIRATMTAYGITAKDLLASEKKRPGRLGKGKAPKATKVAQGPKAVFTVAVKFKGPNGETWSGRGLSPKWLTALVAQGRSKDEFLVNAQAAAEAAAG